MKAYLTLMRQVYEAGLDRQDRTGTGTRSVFGHQMRFNLQEGFPLLTTKRCHMHSIVHELLWFLAGQTNIRPLQEKKVTIWNAWADADGELGPVYGKQWRAWQGPDEKIDQIANVIQQLRNDPTSRRMLVVAWNVGEIKKMALPPCHLLFQFYVAEGKLSCQLYQRSCDLFLGVPFNIASYALLTHLLCDQTGLAPGEFVWTGGDIHLYHNHFAQVELQLTRTPRTLPQLRLQSNPPSIDAYRGEDVVLEGYDPYPAIRAPVAV